MSSKVLRISPSGPIVGGASTPFYPGPGARLRLVEAACTVSAATVIPTVPVDVGTFALVPADLDLVLADPNVGLHYRARVVCDVGNPTTNASGEVQLYLDSSLDGGTTWVQQASNTHTVNESTVDGTSRQIELSLPLTIGASMVTSNPQSASLMIRARIGASSGGNVLKLQSYTTAGPTPGGSKGTVHVELEECL